MIRARHVAWRTGNRTLAAAGAALRLLASAPLAAQTIQQPLRAGNLDVSCGLIPAEIVNRTAAAR